MRQSVMCPWLRLHVAKDVAMDILGLNTCSHGDQALATKFDMALAIQVIPRRNYTPSITEIVVAYQLI